MAEDHYQDRPKQRLSIYSVECESVIQFSCHAAFALNSSAKMCTSHIFTRNNIYDLQSLFSKRIVLTNVICVALVHESGFNASERAIVEMLQLYRVSP